MVRIWIVVGALLGAVSRFEEATAGFFVGVSTSTTWLAVAFSAGVFGRAPRSSALLGAATLTAANAGYYVYGGLYGPVAAWLALGLGGGAVFGVLGWVCRRGPAPWAVVAAAVLVGVGAFEVLGLQVRAAGFGVP